MIPPTVAVCLAATANAQMLTFDFSGTLTQVVPDNSGFPDIWGSVGDPFSGTLSFDPTWLNSPNDTDFGGDSTRVDYGYERGRDPAEQAITMDISTPFAHKYIGVNPTDIGPDIIINDTQGNCSFTCWGEYGGSYLLNLILTDPTGPGLSGTSVPSDLDLSDWATHEVVLGGPGGNVYGEITSLQVVPEPRAEMMLGVGIIIWSFARRTIFQAASR
jgi:hypothetical protein